MSRAKADSLLSLTESFFRNYLQRTRGASAHTVRAYRDALKLLFLFLASQKRKPVADLGLDDIQSDAVLAFLATLNRNAGTPPLHGIADSPQSAVLCSISCGKM